MVNSPNIINGSNFLAVILSSDDMKPEEQIKKGISAIDLGDCTQIIKQYYNISDNESLIILNIELENIENKKQSYDNSFNLGKKNIIEIFDNSGKRLNLSVCNKNIKIMKYIGDIAQGELDIDSAIHLANIGIDVFNPKDDCFNNICKQNDDKDMILNDRRNDIFQNATFCQIGCKYTGMNYNLMVANCMCNSYSLEFIDNNDNNDNKNNQNEKINFSSIKKHILCNLFNFNIDIMKCYNLTFNIKILIYNIGFYSMSIMLISQLIFLFVFFIKRLKPLKYFMILFYQGKSKNIVISLTHKLIKSSTNNILHYNKEDALDTKINKNIKKKNKKKIKKKNIDSKIKNNMISENENNNENSERKININENLSKENKLNIENILINKNLSLEIKTDNNEESNSKYRLYEENLKQKIYINNQINNIYIKKKILNLKNGNKKETNERKRAQSKNLENIKLFKNKNKDGKTNKKKINKILNEDKKISKKMKTNFKKNIHFMKTKIEEKDDKNINKLNRHIINLPLTNEDFQNMDYIESIMKDKRSFIKIYWDFLVDKLIILGTFFTSNYLNLFIIKLSFLVYTFQINFFLNALFYTDEYISESYHNNGVLDFISGLPKSFYSFAATLIITNLLQMLSNNKRELMQVIKHFCYNIDYVFIIDIKLRKLRNKLIAYYIIVFLLGLFFLYYVTSFCATYRHSQKY